MSRKNKMTICKHCGAEIAKSAKICPHCGGKNKKPIYKRKWFIVLVILIILIAISNIKSKSDTNDIPEDTKPQETTETRDKETSDTDSTIDQQTKSQGSQEQEYTDIREATDDCEAFFNEYVDFMLKYKNTNEPTAEMLADYSDMLMKYTEYSEKMDNLKNSDTTIEDMNYILAAESRILDRLSEIE